LQLNETGEVIMIGNIIKYEKCDSESWNQAPSQSEVARLIARAKKELIAEIKDSLSLKVKQEGNCCFEVDLYMDDELISNTEFWV
jgi:hypothetical protein